MSSAPSEPSLRRARFARFARFNVVYNLAVILWGAFVRATGSGAGCGDHWPTCNGEVVPMAPAVETVIEFTHRLTSGGALILALVLAVWAVRVWPARSPTRRAAGATLGFMIVEALVGAAIVLLQMTADNDTIGRAVVMGVHLVNTLLLLGAMVLTAWFASGRPVPRLSSNRTAQRCWAFPWWACWCWVRAVASRHWATPCSRPRHSRRDRAGPLSDGPHSHSAAGLSPIIAIVVGGYTVVAAVVTGLGRTDHGRSFALALVGLIIAQVTLGALNVVLLAPVWMQLVHLLMADLVWMVLVLLAATVLTPNPEPRLQSVRTEVSTAG